MYGNRLKSLRKNLNKTQEEVAAGLGVSRGAYSHFENDRNEPDSETLSKIADYFQVSIDYLLGRTDDPTPVRAGKTLDEFFEGRNSPADQELKIVLAAEGSGMFSNYEGMSEEEKMIIVNFFKAQQALKEKEAKEGK